MRPPRLRLRPESRSSHLSRLRDVFEADHALRIFSRRSESKTEHPKGNRAICARTSAPVSAAQKEALASSRHADVKAAQPPRRLLRLCTPVKLVTTREGQVHENHSDGCRGVAPALWAALDRARHMHLRLAGQSGDG